MNKPLASFLVSLIALLGLTGSAGAGGAIHGTVFTRDGAEITGDLRWDKNENFWDDVIDASKKDWVWSRDRQDGFDLRIFGMQFFHSGSGRHRTHSLFSIPFGHIAAIEPENRDLVRITLKNGRILEVREGADLGPSMRDILVDDGNSEVDLDWNDIRRVEFSPGEDTEKDRDRLYGTVTTSVGDFTGFIVWDKDESLMDDILDGEEDGLDREVPFRDIAWIERESRGSSRVGLHSGKEMVLRGTNDVNQDNRGIDVTIEDLGRVIIDWSEFRRVDFAPPPPSIPYGAFDGGHPLTGTVELEDGRSFSGEIVWDKDEEYTWEAVNGEIGQVEFEILFQYVSRIERVSRDRARVVLRDGLEFTLEGSNDVNHMNKGILVRDEAGETEVGWNDFTRVVFR